MSPKDARAKRAAATADTPQENQPVGASAGTHVVVKLMPFREVIVFFIVLPSSEISKVEKPTTGLN